MTPDPLRELLQRWRAQGWLRALDLAFADFLHQLDAEAPASVLLAGALLAHLEGHGHSCLPLQAFLSDPQATLAWPPEAAAELTAAVGILPADGDAALAAWAGRSVLQIDAVDAQGSSPLVLQADRLYLRRYWRYENRVAVQVRARVTIGGGGEDMGATLDRVQARALLDRLFASPTESSATAEVTVAPDWQKVACAVALRGRLTLITGGPGTGKTYTAARLLVLLQALHAGAQPLRVALAAPTGKAAARLRQSIGAALQGLQQQLGDTLPLAAWAAALGPARTLHALLGTRPGSRRFVHDAANPLDVDLLIVDEASMVHLEMMATLLDALPAGARLVLLGDRDQLASVEAGAVMGDLCGSADAGLGSSVYDAATVDWIRDLTGQVLLAGDSDSADNLAQQTVVLRRSRRFSGPIGELALAVNRGDGAAALATLRAAPNAAVSLIETADAGVVPRLARVGRPGAVGGYRNYLDALAQRPADPAAFETWAVGVLAAFDSFRVLCAVRDGPWGVSGLNVSIERALADHGLLQRRSDWYPGRPVMVTRNDPALGVFNGDIGVVLKPPGVGPLRAYFLDGAELHSVSVGRLADVETAFAMTVHKSQGSEFGHVVVVLPAEDSAVLTRELVYTGITRARGELTLVTPQASSLALATGRLTRRLSGLRQLLDG
jgi:exodeoxyribonuclease V alpha subunit